jgi:hypothetical protein
MAVVPAGRRDHRDVNQPAIRAGQVTEQGKIAAQGMLPERLGVEMGQAFELRSSRSG